MGAGGGDDGTGGLVTTGGATIGAGTDEGSAGLGGTGGGCSVAIDGGGVLCSLTEVGACVEGGGADVQPTMPAKHPNVNTMIDVLRNVTILNPPFLSVRSV